MAITFSLIFDTSFLRPGTASDGPMLLIGLAGAITILSELRISFKTLAANFEFFAPLYFTPTTLGAALYLTQNSWIFSSPRLVIIRVSILSSETGIISAFNL